MTHQGRLFPLVFYRLHLVGKVQELVADSAWPGDDALTLRRSEVHRHEQGRKLWRICGWRPPANDKPFPGRIAGPRRPPVREPPTAPLQLGLLEQLQHASIEVLQAYIDRLVHPAAKMHIPSLLPALQLPFLKKSHAGDEHGQEGRRLMHFTGKGRGRPRLVVILQKAHAPPLKIIGRPQVPADRAGILRSQPVIHPLVVRIIKALLHEGPFQIPVNFRQEDKFRTLLLHHRNCLGPERRVYRRRTIQRAGLVAPGPFHNIRQ